MLGIAVTLLLATPMASGLLLGSLEGAAPAVLRPRRGPSSSLVRRPGTVRTAGRRSADTGTAAPRRRPAARDGPTVARHGGRPAQKHRRSPPPCAPSSAGFRRSGAVGEAASRNTGDNLRLAPPCWAELASARRISSPMTGTCRGAARGGARRPAGGAGGGARPRRPDGRLTDWLPRADCLAMSWLALREWGGLAAMKLGL